MSDTVVLFLAADGNVGRWLRVAGGAIVARGEGMVASEGEDELRWVAVAPAAAVTLHWAELPDASLAQAAAAARLLVAEASATPLALLHVAVGQEGQPDRPIGVVAAAEIERWLAALAMAAIEPHAIVPAPMLLPRPEAGYLRADLGGEAVVRGLNVGFADEPGLTELIVADEPLETLGREQMEAAVVAAAAAPALDLRQGAFARRRQRAIDWGLVRRLGGLVAAILLVTLLISIVKIARYEFAADRLEAEADALARSGLPPGETVNDAGRQLATRLARLRGAGAGFSRTAAAVFSAVRAVPGTTATALQFDATGALRVSISAPGDGQANDVVERVRGFGFQVTPGTFTSGAGGKVSGDITVGAP